MAGNHGGARPGAGRKPKAELFATAIRKAEKRIGDRLPDLIDNMLTLANGVTVQVTNGDGTALVYTEKPDRAANEYLINRLMGKPTDKSEADVNLTGAVQIYLPARKSQTVTHEEP